MTKPPCPNCGKTLTRHVGPDGHLEEKWCFRKRIYCGRKCAKGHYYATRGAQAPFYEARRGTTTAVQEYLCGYQRLGGIPDESFTA